MQSTPSLDAAGAIALVVIGKQVILGFEAVEASTPRASQTPVEGRAADHAYHLERRWRSGLSGFAT